MPKRRMTRARRTPRRGSRQSGPQVATSLAKQRAVTRGSAARLGKRVASNRGRRPGTGAGRSRRAAGSRGAGRRYPR